MNIFLHAGGRYFIFQQYGTENDQ